MVLKALLRYVTSFLGVICHTIGGLAAILALPALILLGVFAMPSTVGSLGVNGLFGGTVTQVVTSLGDQTPLSTTRLAIATLGLFGIYVLGSRTGHALYRVGQPSPEPARAAEAGSAARDGATAASPRATYRRKFSNVSYAVGVFVGVAAALAVVSPSVIPSRLVWGLGTGTVQVLLVVLTVGYAFAGYGARQGWAESMLVGMVLFLVNLISGLAAVNSLGILMGLFGLYYGIRGIRGSTFVFLDVGMAAIGRTLHDRLPARLSSVVGGTEAGVDDEPPDRQADREPTDADPPTTSATEGDEHAEGAD